MAHRDQLPIKIGLARFFIAVVTTTAMSLSCGAQAEIESSSADLGMSNGLTTYRGKPFSGTLVQKVGDNYEIRRTSYVSGQEHGIATVEKNGKLTEQRHFQNGNKHGVHRGWFEDGTDRFYTEFTDGRYSGEHWTWHSNGKVAEYKKYTTGGQIQVHKHWRESGQIYRNQVFAVNAEMGMPGVKLCNTVKQTVQSR